MVATGDSSLMTTLMSLTARIRIGRLPAQVRFLVHLAGAAAQEHCLTCAPVSVVFPSTNTKFSWSVFGNGQELPDYAAAGMADNTYVHFWIYKDKPGATLYTVDGWDCKSVYWGF